MATRCNGVTVSVEGEPPPDGGGLNISRGVKIIGGMAVGGVAGALVRGR